MPRYDHTGRKLKWYQSSMHSVMGSEAYQQQREENNPYHWYEEEYPYSHRDRLQVDPQLSYVGQTVLTVKNILIGICVAITLIVVLGGFMVMGAMQTAVSQQIHPNVQDGKVCGHSYTHNGTPITLKSQTDTSFDLSGHVYTSTNCGY